MELQGKKGDGSSVEAGGLPKHHKATKNEKLVIVASSLGTMFEWYDFYLYGLLATYISGHFFSGVNETTAFILALAAFAAGFAIRPFGSLVFGRIGDLVGRKYTFLVTMGIMGLSTFAVGLLPNYESIGIAAPIILVGLRLLQGLAVGGEYGGAATYVAEHAPNEKRGLYTSFIQTTATVGLIVSLMLVIGLRSIMGEEAFAEWGWRIPFLVSILLLAISLWIRMQLAESPVFQKMKEEGRTAKAPIKEAFGQWRNVKFALIALLGAVAGQAVMGYTAQFYTLFYLVKILKVDPGTANVLIAISLMIGTPFFVIFAWLSDKIGRKPIIVASCFLAMIAYFPAFEALTNAANPALAAAVEQSPVTVTAYDAECSVQFDPVGENTFDKTSCDIAKSYLATSGINYDNADAPKGTVAYVSVGGQIVVAPSPAALTNDQRSAAIEAFGAEVKSALDDANYPHAANPDEINKPLVVLILVGLMILATASYAPLAALLVEMFSARIRYTAMSLPYHIGNGWFGGFLPSAAFAMVAATGDIYFGLWYPVVIAGMTFVVGALFLPETFRRNIDD